jgi:hypothetical protein
LSTPPEEPSHRIARLRYRHPHWSPTTATRVRIYARMGDAVAASWKLRDRGYTVEICTSRRWPWRVVSSAPWSAVDVGEVSK